MCNLFIEKVLVVKITKGAKVNCEEMKNELKIAPSRNPYVVWDDFVALCKSGKEILVYEDAPSDDANRFLKLYTNEDIASWFASLTSKPKFIKVVELEKNIMEGPAGTPVYSYLLNYGTHNLYVAIFERLKSEELQQILKSLKLNKPKPKIIN